MREALGAKEWKRAEQAHEDGLKLLETEEPKVDVLWWKATYHRLRYSAGQPDGIEALKTLAEENPSSPEPLASLSICFYHFQEYEESAEFALKAARLASEEEAIDNLVFAAKALRKANKPQDALKILLDACKTPTLHEASNLALRKELYALLKDFKDSYLAFAVGEWTLHENPGAGDFRFSLAYDYEEKNVDDLCLFHYRILRDNEPKDASVLNNIGAASAKLNLPIFTVDSYAEAYKKGNTLSADNLARLHLSGGFTSEAAALVKDAMKLENYEPRLPGTLAAIDESRKKEEEREKSFLEEAEKHRRFLLKLGGGYLQDTPALDGAWRFPDARIPLKLTAGALSGETQLTVNLPPSSLGVLFGGPSETRQETRKILFTGKVEGRTCKFRLETETVSVGAIGSILGSNHPVREGYIAFSAEGTSGEFYSISKAVVA